MNSLGMKWYDFALIPNKYMSYHSRDISNKDAIDKNKWNLAI